MVAKEYLIMQWWYHICRECMRNVIIAISISQPPPNFCVQYCSSIFLHIARVSSFTLLHIDYPLFCFLFKQLLFVSCARFHFHHLLFTSPVSHYCWIERCHNCDELEQKHESQCKERRKDDCTLWSRHIHLRIEYTYGSLNNEMKWSYVRKSYFSARRISLISVGK